jgi:hypothetical protein
MCERHRQAMLEKEEEVRELMEANEGLERHVR